MKYSLTDYGFDNPQYFQGHASAWDSIDSIVGCGYSQKDSFDDLLEQMAQSGHQELAALVETENKADYTDESCYPYEDEDEESMPYYIGIDIFE
jgi:hypothetical protein